MVTPMNKRLTTAKGAAHQCLSIGRKLPSCGVPQRPSDRASTCVSDHEPRDRERSTGRLQGVGLGGDVASICSWCPGSAPMPKLNGLFALPPAARTDAAAFKTELICVICITRTPAEGEYARLVPLLPPCPGWQHRRVPPGHLSLNRKIYFLVPDRLG